jgi:BlaI family penicillinase repressor
MDKSKNARISESEWEVMRVLWDAEKPLAAAEVTQRLEGRADWKPKTVRTFLTRLAKKQAISAEKIGPAGFELLHYAPLVDEPTTLHAEQETFLGRFFGGTIQSMLAAYIESGNISQDDLRELRAMIDREMNSRDGDRDSGAGEVRP